MLFTDSYTRDFGGNREANGTPIWQQKIGKTAGAKSGKLPGSSTEVTDSNTCELL
jgi:hypothetical protein